MAKKNESEVCRKVCREWKSPVDLYVCPSYESCQKMLGRKVVSALASG